MRKKNFLLLGLGIIIFILIFQFIKVKEVLFHIKSVNLTYLILAFLMTFMAIIFRSLRWAVLLKNLKHPVKFVLALQATVASFFVISILPRISADFYRAYVLKKSNNYSFIKMSAIGLLERFIDILLILIIGIVWLFYIVNVYHLNINVWFYLIPLILVLGTGWIIWKKANTHKIVSWINNTIFKNFSKTKNYLQNKIDLVYKKFKEINFTSEAFYYQIFFSIIVWVFHALHFYFVVLSLGVNRSIFSIAPIFFIALLVSTLTFIPSGLGSKEVTLIFLFGLIGVKAEVALTIAIIERLLVFFRSMIYSTFYYWLMRKLKISKNEIKEFSVKA
jgi:uncharacterized protein (TIRG00374 family)